MNKNQKIELLSQAIAVEIKLLIAEHYSCEEIAEITSTMFIKSINKLLRVFSLSELIQIYKENVFKSVYVSIKFYYSYRKMLVEVPLLVKDSFKLLKEKNNEGFNMQAPLSFNLALSAIVDDEICTILSKKNSASILKYANEDNSTNSLLF